MLAEETCWPGTSAFVGRLPGEGLLGSSGGNLPLYLLQQMLESSQPRFWAESFLNTSVMFSCYDKWPAQVMEILP